MDNPTLPTTDMSLAPLSAIKSNLDRVFGPDWSTWEVETISDTLGMGFNDLLLDKLNVLEIMVNQPSVFYENAAFFLHATDVINNKVADFDSFPLPTSLEVAFCLTQAGKILKSPKLIDKNNNLYEVVLHILREEGYSEPVAPFLFIQASDLEPGQTKEDTEAKGKAIVEYIKHMENL